MTSYLVTDQIFNDKVAEALKDPVALAEAMLDCEEFFSHFGFQNSKADNLLTKRYIAENKTHYEPI